MINDQEIDAYEDKLSQLIVYLQDKFKSTKILRETKNYQALYEHYTQLRHLQQILLEISETQCFPEEADFYKWDNATEFAGDIINESIRNGQWDWVLDLGYCKSENEYQWVIQLSYSERPTEEEWKAKVTEYLKKKGLDVIEVSIAYSYCSQMFILCKIKHI
jgi:hypothetical protein